jgi:hypothetical protein
MSRRAAARRYAISESVAINSLMRPVRESSFFMILLAFTAIGRPEKWAAMAPDLPEPFGGIVRPGRESWNSA